MIKDKKYPYLRKISKYWYGAEGCVQIRNNEIKLLIKEIKDLQSSKPKMKKKKLLRSLLEICNTATKEMSDIFFDAD